MATIKFLLKKSKLNKDGKAPIYVAIYHEDETELIFTKEYIKPSLWDHKNQRVRAIKSLPEDAADIDVIIGKFHLAVLKIQRDLKSESEIDPSAYEIKKAWTEKLESKSSEQREKESNQKESNRSISVTIDKWISNLTYQPLTIKAITNSMKKFKEFLSLSSKSKLQDITKDLVDEYGKWLFEKKKLAHSSHGRHIKHLRWFLRTIKPTFDIRDLKINNFPKAIISLSLAELKKLEAVDVSYSTELQKSKDLFLLGCYTGLRISDLKRITKSSIKDGEIQFMLLKNKKEVQIPLLPETKGILSKYNQKAPKISEQTLNKSIKIICEKAKIKDLIKYTYTKGGKRIDTDIPKHKLISSHIAGKTFISLAFERWGLTPAEIASIVGKDVKTILTYYFRNNNKSAKEKMISNHVPLLQTT